MQTPGGFAAAGISQGPAVASSGGGIGTNSCDVDEELVQLELLGLGWLSTAEKSKKLCLEAKLFFFNRNRKLFSVQNVRQRSPKTLRVIEEHFKCYECSVHI